MIRLLKNSSNIIAVTASKNAVGDDTYYFLFRFFNIEQNKDYMIQLDRENPASNRWDKFTLILPTDLDLPQGKYHYYIYQSETDGSVDYDGLTELDNGKAIIPDDEESGIKFETKNERDYTFDFS